MPNPDARAQLIITRGYPASGKTTWAKTWVESHPEGRIRANRDDLRQSMFGIDGVLPFADEQLVTKVQQTAVRAALRAGKDVVVDDTNLRLRFARAWADLAVEMGADFSVMDFDTSVEDCIDRDYHRCIAGQRYVGAEVIRMLASKFPIGRWPAVGPSGPAQGVLPPVVRKYEPNLSLPTAWLVDIDGTLAHMNGRGPHDLTRVSEDTVDTTIADLVGVLWHHHDIVFLSGREATPQCERDTRAWLDHNVGYGGDLFMRPEGDHRKDFIVKAELFDAHVRDRWNVVGVLDDRDQVVAMWRAMGLKVLQVAEGAF